MPISFVSGYEEVKVSSQELVYAQKYFDFPADDDVVIDIRTQQMLPVPHSVSKALIKNAAKRISIPVYYRSPGNVNVFFDDEHRDSAIHFDNGSSASRGSHDIILVSLDYGDFAVYLFDSLFPISSNIPEDIPGGAPNASLADAAVFAWQEFIALNWPAVNQNDIAGQTTTRDKAATNKLFGQSFSDEYTNPLVWETFRGKLEIYPGKGSGRSNLGKPTAYNIAPDYNWEYSSEVLPCSGSTPAKPAWVNLDETNEIGRASMYAGIVNPNPGAKPNDAGVYPKQQFLYVAKANHVEYNYATKNRGGTYWNLAGVPQGVATATRNFIGDNHKYPPSASSTCSNTDTCVSLPNGTIELKSAWRQLNSGEESEFYTAPVRYYLKEDDGSTCYVQTNSGWGMAALHINHKTPSAPYFTFATFDQVNNIVTNNGSPVENPNGVIIANQSADPTSPNIVEVSSIPSNKDQTIVYEVAAKSASVQQVFDPYLNPPTGYSTTHDIKDKSLYYRNTPETKEDVAGSLLPQFPITINKRQIPIPEEVIAVNALAHDAIANYNLEHNLDNSPWLNYRLINVQYKPLTKAPGVRYTGENPGGYYLSNDVVETDYNLQFFSGKFYLKGKKLISQGLITDYAPPGQIPAFGDSKTGQFFNAFNAGQGFTSAGCMGCHGVAANFGADFSFILLNSGRTLAPEAIADSEVSAIRTQQLFDALTLY